VLTVVLCLVLGSLTALEGVAQEGKVPPTALLKEIEKWLEESIAQAGQRARPTLAKEASTLEEARKLAIPEQEAEGGMGAWAAEYKGWFVFAYGTTSSPIRGFRGIAVKKGTREMGRFGSW
jgi:hypothetical protein